MEIYDISQTISENLPVWPGDQEFSRRWNMRLARGNPCNLSSVTMSLHAGTHLDAPFHFDDQGNDMGTTALENFIGPARVATIEAERGIEAADLLTLEWCGVERILFRTRSSRWSETRFDPQFAYLTEEAAGFLGEKGMLLVGIDSPSVDLFGGKTMGAHKTLQSHGVMILEGVRLFGVPDGEYELVCLPLKIAGADGSPVRAILRR